MVKLERLRMEQHCNIVTSVSLRLGDIRWDQTILLPRVALIFSLKSRHLCKVGNWYEAVSLLVKHPESLSDLLLDVAVVDLSDEEIEWNIK